MVLARDLDFMENALYDGVAGRVVEIKRMLASVIQKLTADR